MEVIIVAIIVIVCEIASQSIEVSFIKHNRRLVTYLKIGILFVQPPDPLKKYNLMLRNWLEKFFFIFKPQFHTYFL